MIDISLMSNAMNPAVWAVIAIIAVVLFGANRIPEMMRGLGSGVKEFKKGIKEDEDEKPKVEEKTETATKL